MPGEVHHLPNSVVCVTLFHTNRRNLVFFQMVATCVDEMELDDEGLGDVNSEDKITLNVGGVAHETLLSTLAKKPGTRLSELAKEHARGDEVANEFYFNRNPRVFNTVIDYYRSGK